MRADPTGGTETEDLIGIPSRARKLLQDHPAIVTTAGGLIVAVVLALVLWDTRGEFAYALGAASWIVLALAVALQGIWLVARSEAWHVCVGAAGGNVERRRLYRAASVGYLGNLFNSNFGLAVRIGALRRSAPAESPKPAVLLAAELPIVVVEVALAALLSFTLIGPLGFAWWIPPVCVAGVFGAIVAARHLVRDRRSGIWRGIEVMRELDSRNRIIALVCFATAAQVARNLLVLEGLGVDVSLLDSVALLIATAFLGLFPIGPTLGAAAAVLILGANGVSVVAAAGVLLTVTGAVAALGFAGWAVLDRLRRVRRPAASDPRVRTASAVSRA